jgi:cardiolipin synthase A/B
MEFQVIDDPLKFYNLLLSDIARAKRYIYLETYKFANDHIGIKFRDALTRKAHAGLEIKILIDSWGKGPITDSFFADLIRHNGQVKFFEKIKLNTDIFTRGHRRDHRKIIVIDDEISFMGSLNITGYNLNWRELALRTRGAEMAITFRKIFQQNFEAFNPYIIANKLTYTRKIRFGTWELVRDVPSIPLQRIKKRYVELIKSAKSRVIIETPYFLPGFLLRKALMDAGKRGVDVKIILPEHSDVTMIDILRNKYLGMLYKSNVHLKFFVPHNLHAKLMVIDDKFAISSANFDYRSFRYQYEIALIGTEPEVLRQLEEHISETISSSGDFNYDSWVKRPLIEKIFERILIPFRHLL